MAMMADTVHPEGVYLLMSKELFLGLCMFVMNDMT